MVLLDPSLRLNRICHEGVAIFRTPDDVSSPYKEVALLDSRGDSDFTSVSGMITSQRKKAAEAGANGIIIGESKDPTTAQKVASALLFTSADRKGSAVAIYIPADSTRVRTACGY